MEEVENLLGKSTFAKRPADNPSRSNRRKLNSLGAVDVLMSPCRLGNNSMLSSLDFSIGFEEG